MDARAQSQVEREAAEPGKVASALRALKNAWSRLGLAAKLLMLTAAFVLIAEMLIFLPSVANYRVSWLNERLTAAQLAALSSEAFPGGEIPSALRADLLRTAQVKAIASRRGGERRLVLPVEPGVSINAHYDLRPEAFSMWGGVGVKLRQIRDAIGVYFAPEGRLDTSHWPQ